MIDSAIRHGNRGKILAVGTLMQKAITGGPRFPSSPPFCKIFYQQAKNLTSPTKSVRRRIILDTLGVLSAVVCGKTESIGYAKHKNLIDHVVSTLDSLNIIGHFCSQKAISWHRSQGPTWELTGLEGYVINDLWRTLTEMLLAALATADCPA